MAQTPAQKRANAKYAKLEEQKRGKPESMTKRKDAPKSPISMGWIIALLLILCSGVIFEVLRLFGIF